MSGSDKPIQEFNDLTLNPSISSQAQGEGDQDAAAQSKGGEAGAAGGDSVEVAGARPVSAVKNFTFRNMTRQDYFCL